MRHYSTSVDLTASFAIGVDELVSEPYFVKCLEALATTMDVSRKTDPSLYSSTEQGVFDDFYAWFERAKEDDLHGRFPQKPVFFYANLNSGHSVVFVAIDGKGKLTL